MLEYTGPKRSNKVKNGKLGTLTDLKGDKKVKEYVDTGKRYPTQVWKYKRDCLTSNLHETQKPIALLENLIKTFSNEGDIVLDSCMGSGSTCVACINTNRKFIGIELNDEYFNIAKKRVEESL
jgi:site-specific DNA-methyltransferase (adenine-specific)